MLACALWGLSFPIGKAISQQALLVSPGLSTWFIAAVVLAGRFLSSALFLLALRPTRISRSESAQGVGLGVFTSIGVLLQMDALNFTEASTSAFLTQGYIVLLPFVAVALERRLPSFRVGIAIGTVVLGLAILSRFDLRTFRLDRGEAETLLAAVFFTLQILWLDRKAYRRNRAGQVTVVMFGTVGLVLSLVALASARTAEDFGAVLSSGPSLVLFFVLAVCCTLFAFWLMNRFQPHLPPNEAAIIYGAEPLFASLFALFLPGMLSGFLGVYYANEVVSERLLIGGGLVTLANVFLQLGGSAEKLEAQTSEQRHGK